MREITATEAARNFADVLDAVEHRHESFRISRGGRPVARLEPVEAASGRAVKDLLQRHAPDPGWVEELAGIRALLRAEERDWHA